MPSTRLKPSELKQRQPEYGAPLTRGQRATEGRIQRPHCEAARGAQSGRPLGWLSERDLQGERVTAELTSKTGPILDLDDVLRDALSDLLADESQYGPVVNEHGEIAGVLSIEILAHALQTPPEEVPSGADAA